MLTSNIFAGQGKKAILVNIIYRELMKGNYVANIDILCLYFRRDKSYYDNHSYSGDKIYIQLKKAFSEVRNALENAYPGCIEDNGKKGKGKACRYIGTDINPLEKERQSVEQKKVEDYVDFCKASASILPPCWLSAYFENTQMLLDINKDINNGEYHIQTGSDQNLINIDLLPRFYNAILNKDVLQLNYQPFGQEPFPIVFHPQFIKEYNGRWFVFGDADCEPYQAHNIPLDRIVGEITKVDNIKYSPAPKGFYQDFFKNIIGVTHERGAAVEKVIIHTKTAYQHGLLMTKPLHSSQTETLPFGDHNGETYGEFSLMVEPNRELRGKLLLFGENLEVISPLTLREQIIESLKHQIAQYGITVIK